jgi:hypothetical protein
MEGEEYALEVTQVQWTANIMSIIITATITIERMFTPMLSSPWREVGYQHEKHPSVTNILTGLILGRLNLQIMPTCGQ